MIDDDKDMEGEMSESRNDEECPKSPTRPTLTSQVSSGGGSYQ